MSYWLAIDHSPPCIKRAEAELVVYPDLSLRYLQTTYRPGTIVKLDFIVFDKKPDRRVLEKKMFWFAGFILEI